MDFALLWKSWICQRMLVYQTGIERKFHEYLSSCMYLTYEFPVALVIYQRFVYQTFGGDGPPKKNPRNRSALRFIFCQVWGHVWSEHRNLCFLIVRRFILPKTNSFPLKINGWSRWIFPCGAKSLFSWVNCQFQGVYLLKTSKMVGKEDDLISFWGPLFRSYLKFLECLTNQRVYPQNHHLFVGLIGWETVFKEWWSTNDTWYL